ncbi:hypothetical protein [Paenibacillus polymyxa]|uniref:Uncharacterized protein n=1 Tax=Paenibacillus polymyxa (strain SC2) TaxID=886882 RepID=E3ELB4_PAEPS|nr:hypothetical protein [Paenibacillus polymyxa]ADO59946.1 hypothetical protein PPSC2_28450 [Paenibacillus polymyxa SC2]WPQ59834.1 hypothetical protein SKN87_26460 [Paenibacillus polymyxa]
MSYVKMFEMVKNEMIEVLEDTTLDNFPEKIDVLSAHIDLMHSLTRLTFYKQNESVSNELLTDKMNADVSLNSSESKGDFESLQETQDTKFSTEEPIKDLPPSLKDDGGRSMYLFERKLEGGYVAKINGYVPEAIIRKQGLQHHDYVYAQEIESSGERKRFLYSLAKRAEESAPTDRVQISLCMLESRGKQLIVRESMDSTGEDFFKKHPNLEFVIQERDITRLFLEEGDLVDIAFYEGNIENQKVIWVHH